MGEKQPMGKPLASLQSACLGRNCSLKKYGIQIDSVFGRVQQSTGIHAIFFSIFTGFFSMHTWFFSILTWFFSTQVSISLEPSRLFCGLFATTVPKKLWLLEIEGVDSPGKQRNCTWNVEKNHPKMLLLGKIFLQKNWRKMWFFTPDFSPWNFSPWKMEKNPVDEKWRKIQYMKNGGKSGIVCQKNAGTWRMNWVVPDAPAD